MRQCSAAPRLEALLTNSGKASLDLMEQLVTCVGDLEPMMHVCAGWGLADPDQERGAPSGTVP